MINYNDNTLALTNIADVNKIDNYLEGGHKVLSRKNFKFKDEVFTSAKIVLQTIKSIIDFHASYICGNPTSITGDKQQVALLQGVYRKGNFNKADYDIAKNLVTYGNAYEYIYKNDKGVIRSKVINNSDAYPIYDNGVYTAFVEHWDSDMMTISNDICYYNDRVEVYQNDRLINTYRNTTGLPIHYTNGNLNKTNIFGSSLVDDLLPIMNEIEALLSKASDSVEILSMNPLGISMGGNIDSDVSKDVTGVVMNLESGSDFKWATAELDYNSIKLLLDSLINQFYTIACVPSSLFGNSNIANVSEVSLKLLFNSSDGMAKRMSYSMLDGFSKRLEYISKLMSADLEDIVTTFNYNRPVDNSSLIADLKTQYDMGCISKESVIRNSPYTSDIDREMKLIDKDLRDKTKNKENNENPTDIENKETNTQDIVS